jgi:glutamyl-tRNA synthetase
MSVRVRAAPSPTGSPHLGILRTALFDYLYAKHHGGKMILRIEDTDRTRLVPGCEEEIIASLRWMGIDWDEGPDVGGPYAPYRQSERKEVGIYAREIAKLLESGAAYKAFDTPEELEQMREFQQINKQPTGYFGGVWRDATPEQVSQAESEGKPHVIRLKIPRDEIIVCQDTIRGRVEFDSNTVDDPVLIKADGMPTYHFAAMVDDHLMEITHIIRGVEWISSAPKHVVLFQAFGWEPPTFVHVQVINGKDGKKLSKRHGDTKVFDFRSAGYLPEALGNFIALIGWAPGGDREIMSREELIEAFDLDGLQPAPGVFDPDKLQWMNGHYIRQQTPENLLGRLEALISDPETRQYWESKQVADGDRTLEYLDLLIKAAAKDRELVLGAIKLEQERVTTLAEFGPACAFFFVDEVEMDSKAVEKWFGENHVPDLLDGLGEFLASRSTVGPAECEAFLRDYASRKGFEKLGPVVHPTRVALTGKTVGPGLFELMSLLGPKRMMQRIDKAKELLK